MPQPRSGNQSQGWVENLTKRDPQRFSERKNKDEGPYRLNWSMLLLVTLLFFFLRLIYTHTPENGSPRKLEALCDGTAPAPLAQLVEWVFHISALVDGKVTVVMTNTLPDLDCLKSVSDRNGYLPLTNVVI